MIDVAFVIVVLMCHYNFLVWFFIAANGIQNSNNISSIASIRAIMKYCGYFQIYEYCLHILTLAGMKIASIHAFNSAQ